MKKVTLRKIIAAVMLISIVAVALIIPSFADDEEIVHTLDVSTDLAEMAQGAKADGDVEKAGTDNFFTIHYSAKTKIDTSSKTFEDGYAASKRINMGGSSEVGATNKNVIEFTTEGPATLKIWWVSGGALRS